MALATRPKPKTHHKKRQAKHHRHSKTYLKAYWPYMPMLMAVAVGLFINTALNKPNVLGAESDLSTSSLLSATNQARQHSQLYQLSLDAQLNAAAQAKADDMVKANYWAHNGPTGQTPWSFITAAGYNYSEAGENLAYGFHSAPDVISAWMNSPAHRDNILSQHYANVGFGVASSPNFTGTGPETIVVAEYAMPGNAVSHITFTVDNPGRVKAASSEKQIELSSKPVARVQVLSGGNATWSLAVVSALTGALLAVFLIHNGFRLKRLLNQGEAFVVHHPVLDVVMVGLIMAGYILTRTSGLIR